MPGLDRILDNPPLSTTGEDAWLEAPTLDGFNPESFAPLTARPRNAAGEFILAPGAYAMDAESYCLHIATRAPVAGNGFLNAPLKGGRADVVRSILRNASAHPDISQQNIQVLLWGLLSRVRVTDLNRNLQAIAARLLTPQELRSVSDSAWDLLDTTAGRRAIRELPQPVQRALRVENDVRNMVRGVNYDYKRLERLAMTPVPGQDAAPKRLVPAGRWMHHPRGFLIRYASKGYPRTRVEIYVPEPYTYKRDALGRILSVKDRQGNGVETTYDDSIRPLTVPGDPRLVGYAFRSLRFVRTTAAGPQHHDIATPGWTFLRTRRAPPRAPAPVMGLVPATFTSAVFRQEGFFERWRERYNQAREQYDRYQYYRERRERMESQPDASAIDDLENNEHYRDGVDAALRGDPTDRLDWIIQQHERQRDALRHADSVLDSLPTTSSADDPAYGPWDDMAIPTRPGFQRLGISGRSR